ncbi:Ger(x)C family spore germination protein [Sporosarcina sp. YIM B06819]|uniref:Ger(x)C family spore germination protein n=1 Tax=Sporosarcina sp. YIM B06819 TaxID=3081769 RepID=UPI00298D17C1|nr:Ger(x)C family spore germination protein [Sporosarcina sp. YIM B06819]
MRVKGFILLICTLLLSGCWDEKQYRDVTNVSLAGLEGTPGNYKAQFAFPVYVDGAISYTTVTGHGISTRGAKNSTNTSQGLDTAELEVLLLADDAAKNDIYPYLDVLFRDPRNRLSANMAVVEGELAPYFEPIKGKGEDISTFYTQLIDTAARYTLVPKIDLQQTCTILFAEDITLALPYIRMDEESGMPTIAGTALFNDQREFTGEVLDRKESAILMLLQKKKGKFSRLDFLWKEGAQESPLSINIMAIKKDWKISDNQINASYKLKVSVEEFPHDSLNKKKTKKDVEDFISKELTKNFTAVVKKLQEAKSDAVGFGQPVRAFHPKLWERGDWGDTFSEIPIQVKVKVEMMRTGILN